MSEFLLTFALANRGVEQLVARQAHNLEVARSSRTSATKKGIFPAEDSFLSDRNLNFKVSRNPRNSICPKSSRIILLYESLGVKGNHQFLVGGDDAYGDAAA